jgi:hypothetical protein
LKFFIMDAAPKTLWLPTFTFSGKVTAIHTNTREIIQQ